MANENGAALVNAGASAASGNYVAAAASLAKAIFSGGGKTPSILQGFDVQGTVSNAGFAGTVTAFDQKGNRWAGTGETAYLQGLGRDLLTADYFHSPLSGAEVDRFFSDGIPVPVSVRIEGNDNSRIPAAVQASITNDVRGFLMNAPTINADPPAGQPATPGASAAAAAAAAASPSAAGAVSSMAGMEKIVTIAAFAGLIFWALKGGKG